VNPRWLRPGDAVAGAAGVLVLVSLLLPWYTGARGRELTGWQALSVIDVLLALAAVLGIALALSVATRRTPAMPIALSVIGTVAGALATLLVLIRIVDAPGDHLDLAVGAWLGLVGAIGLGAGAWSSLRDERNRGVPPVAVELRPAPPRI
jgi:peptidoglycan/LPS O-acetylase OafA/YrhL